MSLWLLASAWATGLPMDIELVQPSFSADGLPGVDDPVVVGRWATQAGLSIAYTRDPLVLYEYEAETGAVVVHRATAVLGGSLDLSDKFSVRVMVPMAWQGGSETPEWAADGVGLQDLTLGGRAHIINDRIVDVGVRLDLRLPTSPADSYLGETWPRGIFGPLIRFNFGPVTWLNDISVQVRADVDSDADFVLGTEFGLSTGATLAVWPEHLALFGSVVGRLGAPNFLSGGAENAAEALLGVRAWPTPSWQVDVGVGRGLTEGYGTTEFRAFAMATWRWRKPVAPEPEPEPQEVVVVNQPPPELDIPEMAPDEPRDWEEGELARVEESKIVIRDPIQFELNTANILPESEPILEAVSELLHTYWQISHLVVEGHASIEGETGYNFRLSNDRARSVFQALVRRGVHPSRLSYRGMGEVVPVQEGEDEAALAKNRRVEFKILVQLFPMDPKPVYPETFLQPWDGELRETVQPSDTMLPTDQGEASGPLEVVP